jgi:glycerol-3-phosphate O-acyltransferase / dihydroxyacetone phosphate acyltransferase
MSSPILYNFIYYLGKSFLPLYYPKRTVINRYTLEKNIPYIVITNHPSTLSDPYLICTELNRQMTFLANYGLFKHPVSAWFFHHFFCIPIQRTLDMGDQKLQNDTSFARCDEHLAQKECLYIAVEGGSWVGRTVRDLRTGAARIALSAEKKQNYQLGVQILPIAITYEHARAFRGDIVVNFGQPIHVTDFQEMYEQDKYVAVKQLTERMAQSLQALTVGTRSDEEDELAEKAEIMLQNAEPLPFKKYFWRAKNFVTALKALPKENYIAVENKINLYFSDLKTLSIKDKYINTSLSKNYIADFFIILLGFPFFLYGLLGNVGSALLPVFLQKKLDLYPTYDSTVKIVAGLVTFPVFYVLQAWLFGKLISSDSVLQGIYLLSLLPAGLAAWHYWVYAKNIVEGIKSKQIIRDNPLKIKELQAKKIEITEQLQNMLSE